MLRKACAERSGLLGSRVAPLGALTALVGALGMLALTPAFAVRPQSPENFVPVTDAMLQDPDPSDWLMWRRTLDGWGFRCTSCASH